MIFFIVVYVDVFFVVDLLGVLFWVIVRSVGWVFSVVRLVLIGRCWWIIRLEVVVGFV